MTSAISKAGIAILPDHPGVLLGRRLNHLSETRAAIAKMLVLSRQTLHEILVGRQGITPGVALRIAKLTGTSAEMWLNLQQKQDLAIARSEMRDLVMKVPTLDEPW